MNFEQAKELSFLVEWKAIECHVSNCWCRKIVPVEPILYTESTSPDDEEEYIIADAGDLDQQTAEYIVKLHNEHHERVKQSCRDAMKETMDSLIPLNHRSVTLTNNPTINDFRTIKRKEID
jgi:hypothetical protein